MVGLYEGLPRLQALLCRDPRKENRVRNMGSRRRPETPLLEALGGAVQVERGSRPERSRVQSLSFNVRSLRTSAGSRSAPPAIL